MRGLIPVGPDPVECLAGKSDDYGRALSSETVSPLSCVR